MGDVIVPNVEAYEPIGHGTIIYGAKSLGARTHGALPHSVIMHDAMNQSAKMRWHIVS